MTGLLAQYEKMTNNQALILQYRFAHLCVKAEPAALLSLSVPVDGDFVNIEDAVDVVKPAWNTLQLIPHEDVELADVQKAVAQEHPEFEQKIVAVKLSADSNETLDTLLLTMPKVDRNRHDALLKGIDTYLDVMNAKLTVLKTATTAKVTLRMDISAEDKKAANEEIDRITDAAKDKAQQAVDGKKKEIEEAFEKYMKEKAEEDAKNADMKAALNPDAAFSMAMGEK